jgi:flagellar operon protein
MSQRITNPAIRDLVDSTSVQSTRIQPRQADGATFEQALQKAQDIKVSSHAQTRLKSRGIDFAEAEWQRVRDGIEMAAAKGSRESLLMIDDVALIVSIKNRTVITAVAKEQLKENVFTNIDSAVIV